MHKWEKIALIFSMSFFLISVFLTLFCSVSNCASITLITGEPRQPPELRVNVNRATQCELMLLPQIGEKRSKEIISLREKRGCISNSDIRDILGSKVAKEIEKFISFSN